MFNQEMPSTYIPRRYMVRGVLNAPVVGTFYEIVAPGCSNFVDWHVDYHEATKLADTLNERYKSWLISN